ncbi:MAG: TonB-dependent receptor plug domain-containing protein [Bacteroidota bacterium]
MKAFIKTHLFFALLLGMFVLLASCTGTHTQTAKIPDPPADSVAEMLRRLPGLQVTGSGENISVLVNRGGRSLMRSDEPLYMIDGRRMGHSYRSISMLNPGDIERIDVISDPASLASYGVGAGKGVINVRMKK